MYRSRQTENLDENVLDYLSSLNDDIQLLYYDIVGTQAHCLMLNKIGILRSDELAKILSTLNKLKKECNDNDNIQDILSIQSSSAEDVHEQIESLIVEKTGVEVGGKMHTGRSRNDQVMLDLRMKIRDDINDMCILIIKLIESLIHRSKDNKNTIISLYTHLQQAQIGTLSHYLLSYSFNLLRDLDRLVLLYEKVNESPLGACAIGGTSIPIDRSLTASLLGFRDIVKNSIDATSSRDTVLEFLSTSAILMTSLSRIAEDFILWSTAEFNYIELTDKFSSTSSVMPQKKNPDPLEILRARSSMVIGHLVTALSIVKGLPSGYSRDLQDLKPLIFDCCKISKTSILVLIGIIDSFSVNKNKMLDSANKSYGVSLDIGEQLVIKYNIPFRKIHKLMGLLVQYSINNNISMDAIKQDQILKILDAVDIKKIKPEDILSLIKDITPNMSIDLRRSSGSPMPAEQDKMIVSIESSLKEYKTLVSDRIKSVYQIFRDLDKIVERRSNLK